jgi:Fic family protein
MVKGKISIVLLKAFFKEPRGKTSAELIRITGLPESTFYRQLNILLSAGLVKEVGIVKTPRGRGGKVWAWKNSSG